MGTTKRTGGSRPCDLLASWRLIVPLSVALVVAFAGALSADPVGLHAAPYAASGTTGEDGDGRAGPLSAPVDPAFAGRAAAKASAKRMHAHHPITAKATQPAAGARTLSAADLDPASFGRWGTLPYALPLRAVHATYLKTGNVLLIAGSGNVSGDSVLRKFAAYLWNPVTDELTSVPVPYDAFCGGHLVDADGNVMVYGGTVRYRTATTPWVGSNKVYKFVVATNKWQAMPPMKIGRWYPTMVMDGKKRQFAYSGSDALGKRTTASEVFAPTTNSWSSLTSRSLPLYPGLQLTATGKVVYTGAHYAKDSIAPKVFAPVGGPSTAVKDPERVIDIAHRNGAMAAMVGSADQQKIWVAGGGFPAVSSTYFLKLNGTSPQAVAGPRLPAPKAYLSVSHLPDLTAFETGGGTAIDTPVYEASILNPTTNRLTIMAPPSVPRTYHSSSLTLADGRVATFGGDPSGDARFEFRVEVYSPPYLFKGTRPTITAAPVKLRYGSSYTVGATSTGTRLASVTLLRPGSATHSVDSNQRALKLTMTPATSGARITLPTNPNLAPPGWYMLFVNDGLGRPSTARWVHLS